MNKIKKDLELGLVSTAIFALLVFWIVPTYIVVPSYHTSNQLSPAAYPTWICTLGLCISLFMTINSFRLYYREAKKGKETKKEPMNVSDFFSLIMAFILLLGFYFTIEILGMFVGCFLLYTGFAILCGEKNWKRLIVVNSILMIIMYGFFVKIAAVPVPLGILSGIL